MITELVLGTVLYIIAQMGYFGIFILMTAESTLLPIPSEAVLPFAGYLTATGQFDITLLIIVSTIGTLVGSLISYYLGKYIGKEIIIRYGKYFLIKKKELDLAHKWIDKHGAKTIFVARFVPVIRHLISLPAGTVEMKRRKFITYTLLGGIMWNTILILVGVQLEKNWSTILNYTQIIDGLIILCILIAFFVLMIKLKKRKVKK